MAATRAVVPGYYLVCYNKRKSMNIRYFAVVPGYYLVCYNFRNSMRNDLML